MNFVFNFQVYKTREKLFIELKEKYKISINRLIWVNIFRKLYHLYKNMVITYTFSEIDIVVNWYLLKILIFFNLFFLIILKNTEDFLFLHFKSSNYILFAIRNHHQSWILARLYGWICYGQSTYKIWARSTMVRRHLECLLFENIDDYI